MDKAFGLSVYVRRQMAGVIAFFMAFMSCFFNYRHFNYSDSRIGAITCLLVSVFFLCVFTYYIYFENDSSGLKDQFTCFCMLTTLLLFVATIRIVVSFLHSRNFYFVVFWLSYYLVFCLISFWRLLKNYKTITRRMLSSLRENVIMIALMLIILVLAHNEKTYFMWDINTMFRFIDNATIEALFDFSKLSFYKHISYAFTAVGILLKITFGNATISQALYGKMLLVIGIYGIWKVLHLIYEKQNITVYILLTLAYSVSPYFLGQVSDVYIDSASWYVFPILVYWLYSRKYVFSFLGAIYFVFCKEPNVVSYSFLILGMYIVEALEQRKIIHDLWKFFVLILPSMIWLFCFCFVFHVTNQGGVVFDWCYVALKIKSLLFLNFNMLFFFLSLTGVFVTVFIKKYSCYFKVLFPLALSMLAFLFFSLFIATDVSHPRYIDAMVSQLYILASFLIIVPLEKNLRASILIDAILVCLLGVSTFLNIDPLMLLSYDKVNVGKKDIYYLQEYLSDGWTTNNQHQNWGYLVDEALQGVIYEGSIFMPASPGNSTWHFDAISEYIPLGEADRVIIEEWWNPECQTRMTDYGNGIMYKVNIVNNEFTFDDISGSENYYIYTDYSGTDIADRIKSAFEIIREESFEKSGWIIHRIQFCK